MMKRISNALIVGLAFMPAVLLAAGQEAGSCAGKTGFFLLLCSIGRLINQSIGILGALALLVFFWGLVKYILKAGDEKAKEEGKNIMTWGVIALFVLFSVFGLVGFLQSAFGLENAPTNIAPIQVDWIQ